MRDFRYGWIKISSLACLAFTLSSRYLKFFFIFTFLFDLKHVCSTKRSERNLKKFWHLHSDLIYIIYLELSAFLFLLSRINQKMTPWFRMRCLRILCTTRTTNGCLCTSPSLPSSSTYRATSGSRWRAASWSSSGRGPPPGLLRTRTRRGRNWSSFSAGIFITSERKNANIKMKYVHSMIELTWPSFSDTTFISADLCSVSFSTLPLSAAISSSRTDSSTTGSWTMDIR